MAKILSISSQVVHGHVGNSVASFVLQRLGHQTLSLPTVLLSNRPGYPAIAGERMAPALLESMLEAGLANGWLSDVDAILTGYLPTPAHAELCARWIRRLKALQPRLIYLCDPILGDEPAGIYIDEAAARAVRDVLLELADIVTPNLFELSWLSGRKLTAPADAISAAQKLRRPSVVITSAPALPGSLANILVEGDRITSIQVVKRKVMAHGTGDFFASIFLAHMLNGKDGQNALEAATLAMDELLEASDGRHELALVEAQHIWSRPANDRLE